MKILTIVILAIALTNIESNVFPYKEFLGLPDQPNKEVTLMMEMYYLCTSTIKYKYLECECSPECMKFRSCCIDSLWQPNQNETVQDYKTRFLSESNKYEKLQCNPVTSGFPRDSGYKADSVLMRTKCLEGVEFTTTKSRCETTTGRKSVRPVLADNGYIYKNKYCAICNNIGEFQRMNLTAKNCIKTTSNSTRFYDKYKDCEFELEKLPQSEESKFIRKCFMNTPKRMCNSSTERCHLCNSYTSGLYGTDGVCYKNFHCLEYHTQTQLASLTNFMPCNFGDEQLLGDIPWAFKTLGSIPKPSYSMLVSFNDLHEEGKCDQGQIFDDILKKCIQDVVCGIGYTQDGLLCKKDSPSFPKGGIKSFSPGGKLSHEDLLYNCLAKYVYIKIKTNKGRDSILNITTKLAVPKVNVVYSTSHVVVLKVSESTYNNNMSALDGMNYEEIKSTVSNHYGNKLFGMDFKRTFPNSRLCSAPVSNSDVKFNISQNCLLFYNKFTLSPEDYVINIYNNGTSNRVELVTCQEYHLQSTCLKRVIKDFTILRNKNATVVSADGTDYPANQYTPLQNSGVAVCISSSPKTSELKVWERIVNGVEGYITIIGCACSIFCYIWVMLTYTIIPALKTIPGKNIVCLCFVLMCSDIIMLSSLANLSYQLCAAFGVMLHYFVLSAQIWAGLIAFDIFSTFHGRSMIRDVKSLKRFKMYLFIGFLCPLSLILLFTVLEFTNTVNFGYGLNGICWITRFHARLITYIIPMATITAFNIFALSYTIYCIYKHSKKSKKLLNKSGGQNANLARMSLKLIILLGAIELLGLLQIQGKSESEKAFNGVFRIIYSTVRAFRGVFIWLLYIVTDRVFNVYRDIKSQRSLYTRSTTTSTTHVTSMSQRSSYRDKHNCKNQDSSQKLMDTSCDV